MCRGMQLQWQLMIGAERLDLISFASSQAKSEPVGQSLAAPVSCKYNNKRPASPLVIGLYPFHDLTTNRCMLYTHTHAIHNLKLKAVMPIEWPKPQFGGVQIEKAQLFIWPQKCHACVHTLVAFAAGHTHQDTLHALPTGSRDVPYLCSQPQPLVLFIHHQYPTQLQLACVNFLFLYIRIFFFFQNSVAVI